jgi:stage V sporulation protein S
VLPHLLLAMSVGISVIMTEYNNDVYGDLSTGHSDNGHSAGPEIIKVSARSRSTAVAGAIAGVIREHGYADIQAIGAGAVNQAVKAMAIARGYLDRDEIDVVFTPHFTEVDIDGQERTAVRFSVEQVNPR